MADVFISYSQQVKDPTVRLARALVERGYDAVFDADLLPFQEFEPVINDWIDTASAVITIWSPPAASSRWVKYEALRARDQGKLLNTRTPDFQPGMLPADFTGAHCTPVTEIDDIYSALVEKDVRPAGKTEADLPPRDVLKRHAQDAWVTRVSLSTDPEEVRDFLRQYSRLAIYRAMARDKLAELAAMEPPNPQASLDEPAIETLSAAFAACEDPEDYRDFLETFGHAANPQAGFFLRQAQKKLAQLDPGPVQPPATVSPPAVSQPGPVDLEAEDVFLRLDPGMHTASIRRLSVSADGRLLATASDDKTVRLWSLPQGRLVRTLRPPIGEGVEGKLYAVALSPDGRWLAAGGWTTQNGDNEPWIHVFDTATGALTHRLGPLPNVVNDLEISPNGTRLAAGLGGANGIRVWQVEHRPDSPPPMGEGPGERGNALTTRVSSSIQAPTFTPLPTDSAYSGQVYGLTFAPDGRLFTTSYDGHLRAYVPDAYATPAQKARAPGGERPFGIALSPDGARLAVGYTDTIKVSLLDPETLEPLGEADTSTLTNGDLGSVAWLADGRLAAAGRYDRAGDYQIQVWDGAGTGARTAWPGGPDTVMDLAPLPAAAGGGLAHGGGGPAWSLLSASGQRLADHGPPLADLRGKRFEHFTLSPDGRRLRFGLEQRSGTPVLFDLGTGGERPRLQAAPQPVAGLQPAETRRLDIDGWINTTRPTLAGEPLTFDSYEMASSLAIAPGGDSFILGTSYWLRRYRADGTLDWQHPVPGVVWGVNIAQGGRLVVAAYGDGTIRWHRAEDGEELLALFIHYEPGKPVHALDWVLWTPEGYFDATPGGEALIGWHVNRGPDREADFYPVETFADTFRRPDRIDAALDGL